MASRSKSVFTGFPEALQGFLRKLEKNNNKSWFDAHREDYESLYLEPAKHFTTAMAPGLKKISSGLQVEPRVNGSIMRINRDTRFSKDKTPYKTGLFMRFAEGSGPAKQSAAFGIHIGPRSVAMMGGSFGFDAQQLKRYRAAVMDAKAGRRLVRAIDAIVASGCELNEPHYKRVPRGLDPRHPRAEWLRHRALHASWEQSPAPNEMFGPEALDFCLERFRAMRPVQKWLVDSLQEK